MSTPNEQPNPNQPTQNQGQPTNAPEQQQQPENVPLPQGAPAPTASEVTPVGIVPTSAPPMASAPAAVVTPAVPTLPTASEVTPVGIAPASVSTPAPPVATVPAAEATPAVPTLPTAPAPVEVTRPTGSFTIYVKTLTGKTITMEQFADSNVKVDDVKAELEKSEGVAKTQMTLIFGGKTMKDDDTLAQHNVKDKNTLHLVLQLRGGAEC